MDKYLRVAGTELGREVGNEPKISQYLKFAFQAWKSQRNYMLEKIVGSRKSQGISNFSQKCF